MYPLGYDCWWKIREAYAHWDTPRCNLSSLIDAGVAMRESLAWKQVKTKSPPSKLDSMHSVVPNMIIAPLPAHGPKAETGRMKATQKACQVLIGAIEQSHHYLDAQKRIDKGAFLNLVQETMAADGMKNAYHATTAKFIYAKSSNLKQFKRPRGHKKSK